MGAIGVRGRAAKQVGARRWAVGRAARVEHVKAGTRAESRMKQSIMSNYQVDNSCKCAGLGPWRIFLLPTDKPTSVRVFGASIIFE